MRHWCHHGGWGQWNRSSKTSQNSNGFGHGGGQYKQNSYCHTMEEMMGDTMSIVPFPKLIIRAKIGWLSFIFNYDAVIEHTVISGLHPKILSYKGCGCCHPKIFTKGWLLLMLTDSVRHIWKMCSGQQGNSRCFS